MSHSKTNETAMTIREQRIFDFINDNHVGVLASVDPNNEPHATVIYHAINKEDFTVSFLTKTGTKKYDNLIRNKHVVLVVFEPVSQSVAQIIGEAHELTNADDINEVAAIINKASVEANQGKVMPIAKLEAGTYTAFKIIPFQIRMARYAHPDSNDYNHLFESIESFDLKPKA